MTAQPICTICFPPVIRCGHCKTRFDYDWQLQVHQLIAANDKYGKVGNVCMGVRGA